MSETVGRTFVLASMAARPGVISRRVIPPNWSGRVRSIALSVGTQGRDVDIDGGIYGGQIGYDYQAGNFVVGSEVSYTGGSIDGNVITLGCGFLFDEAASLEVTCCAFCAASNRSIKRLAPTTRRSEKRSTPPPLECRNIESEYSPSQAAMAANFDSLQPHMVNVAISWTKVGYWSRCGQRGMRLVICRKI